MTDRIRHLTVTLDKDYRDDDVQAIVSAIEHIRGVGRVATKVSDLPEILARETVRVELQAKLHDAVEGVFRSEKIKKLAER